MKKAMSFRLSDEAKVILREVAQTQGLSQASVIEDLLRERKRKLEREK